MTCTWPFRVHCFTLICRISQGGIKAVVWTDVVQATVMVGSTLLTVYMGLRDVGGVANVFKVAEEGDRLDWAE